MSEQAREQSERAELAERVSGAVQANKCSKRLSGPFKTGLSRVETGPMTNIKCKLDIKTHYQWPGRVANFVPGVD